MSRASADPREDRPSENALAIRTGVGLLGLLGLTVWLAHVDLGGFNEAASLAIATAKAGLVVWFFMELRHGDRGVRIAAAFGLVLMLALLLLTFFDHAARSL